MGSTEESNRNSALALWNTLLSMSALVLGVVGIASPNWLVKDFLFPVHRGGMDFLPVSASIGLFTACKTETYLNGQSYDNCSPEGAADWQIISAALAIAGLVMSLLAAILSLVGVVVSRLRGRRWVKVLAVFYHLLACGFYVGPLLMMPSNKRIQVKPQLSLFQVDFELGWSYCVAAASTGLLAVLALLNLLDMICWLSPRPAQLGNTPKFLIAALHGR